MACLLYCVTLISGDPIPNLIGAGEQPVAAYDSGDLRFYWSGVANPETLLEGASRKSAALRYRQVLREMAIRATTIALPFPGVVASLEDIDALVSEQREFYVVALTRFAGTVQYELSATWSDTDQADLATPISGKEYLKRCAESAARVAAIDAKLKAVTAGIVREWRSRQELRRHLWFALMEREDRERFVAALRTAGGSEGVRLRLSGAWPPNEFLSDRQ